MVKFIATLAGLGYSRIAPGTTACLAAAVLYLAMRENIAVYCIAGLALLVTGFFVSGKAEVLFDSKDAKQIVIDDACGLLIALFLIPFSYFNFIIVFLLFRTIDIAKPFPIRRVEKLPGALGIMGDDIVAGIYANLVFRLALKFVAFCIAGLMITSLIAGPCLAKADEAGILKGVELSSGWGQASLKTKQDYHFIPIILGFDFDIKRLSPALKSHYPGLLEFQIEPFFSYVLQPNRNIEIGNIFALKAGALPETFAFQPYIKGGVGGIFITQHIREQSTQLNFCEYAAGGAHYFFDKNTGINFEFRLRHLSNGRIKLPNNGITSWMYIVGLTHRF
ncbi:MAG: phosphatidylglycerophosphatase A [Candidatus Omnitrophica bacterium]|nr:phosphatidylglycerophosphatase A [Candidatus Omnitrophota bacterium]